MSSPLPAACSRLHHPRKPHDARGFRTGPTHRVLASGTAALVCAGVTLTALGAAATPAAASPVATSAVYGTQATTGQQDGREHVIVQLDADVSLARGAALVRAAHGAPGRYLDIAHALSAVLPQQAVTALRHTTGIRAVTPDARLRALSVKPATSTTASTPVDTGSMDAITTMIGAKSSWAADTRARASTSR